VCELRAEGLLEFCINIFLFISKLYAQTKTILRRVLTSSVAHRLYCLVIDSPAHTTTTPELLYIHFIRPYFLCRSFVCP